MRQFSRRLALGLAATLLAAPAAAKVAFTGYGDIQATPHSRFRIDGPGSVLSGFSLGAGHLESRGAVVDALGLFAATNISDETRFLMDVTYRDIGVNARTIRIQYAYLDHAAYGANWRAGKITLPFGWYNQNYFYPFQRPSITGPVFQSGILGLPMTDIGGSVSRDFPAGELVLRTDVYAVNGFGPVSGSTSSLRNAGLPGGLTIANNIASRDGNHKVSLGARAELGHSAHEGQGVGASYYVGEWGTGGARRLQMASAHAHLQAGGFGLITEYLYMRARGDEGMLRNFDSRNWRTDGFFAILDYKRLSIRQMPLTVWARFEDYFTYGDDRGKGRESLWGAAAGAALRLNDGLTAKVEGNRLYYKLPYYGVGDITLDGFTTTAAVSFSF